MTAKGLGLVIGHRGAPTRLAENTIPSFRLACRSGADSIETDIQCTRDGVLVLIHDTEISRVTDVARHREFASRRTTRIVGRKVRDGWFVDDFTFAELRTLNTPSTRIPSLDEFLVMLAQESRRAGRRIGLHAEVKKPAYFVEAGLPIADLVLSTLRAHGLDKRGKRVWIQSFDETFLREVRPRTEVPLVQLVEAGQPFSCDEVTTYADAIGPDRKLVLKGDARQARRFFDAGVDGVFSDDPASAVAARTLVPAT